MATANKSPINLQAFDAICTFVKDLCEVFSKNRKKASPLLLYRRLIDHILFSDKTSIEKSISGFEEFFNSFGSKCLDDVSFLNIPENTNISYGTSDKVYIELGRFVKNSNPSTQKTIRMHLLTIFTLLHPEKGSDSTNALEKIASSNSEDVCGGIFDENTEEGKFIGEIMKKAISSMEKINVDDPKEAVNSLFQSGVLQELIIGLQSKVESGKLDMGKLINAMKFALSGSGMPNSGFSDILETVMSGLGNMKPK